MALKASSSFKTIEIASSILYPRSFDFQVFHMYIQIVPKCSLILENISAILSKVFIVERKPRLNDKFSALLETWIIMRS